MQRRSLRVVVVLTLLASFLASSFSFLPSAAAAPPSTGGSTSGERERKGIAPHEATQATVATPNGQTAVTWGNNNDLQACNGDFSGHAFYAPKPNNYLSGVTATAAGEYHSLYLLSDGTVYACGYDGEGAMGNGLATGFDFGTPQPVLGVCPSPSPLPSAPSTTAPPCRATMPPSAAPCRGSRRWRRATTIASR